MLVSAHLDVSKPSSIKGAQRLVSVHIQPAMSPGTTPLAALVALTALLAATGPALAHPAPAAKLRFITRAEWGAKPPKEAPVKLPATPKIVLVHHTDTRACSDRAGCDRLVRSIQHYHRDIRGWNDIGYHFLIVPSGDVYVGRGWGVVGAQAGVHYYNLHSIGVAFIGNYSADPVPAPMWPVFNLLLSNGLAGHQLATPLVLKGHRDVRATSCPGKHLYAIVRADPRYQPGPRRYTVAVESARRLFRQWWVDLLGAQTDGRHL